MATPSPCPVCGAYSLAPAVRATTLLAVSDVLVHKALDQLGRYLVREERSRFATLGDRPFSEAHTIWRASDALVSRVLRTTWDIVPLLVVSQGPEALEACDVVGVLDDYVHDLAVSGYPHTIDQLAYRFSSRLNLPVLEAAWA